jgi:hypothetical protein
MKLARRLLAKLRTSKAPGGSPAVVERAEHIFYINYLNEGMTVFDVGANCGGLSLLFVHFVGPSGHIHSFEAASSTFERLTAVC